MLRIIGAKSASKSLLNSCIARQGKQECIRSWFAVNVHVLSRGFSDKKKPVAPAAAGAPVKGAPPAAKSSSSSAAKAAGTRRTPTDPHILEKIKKNAEFMKTNPFRRTQGPSNTTTVHLTKLDGTVTLSSLSAALKDVDFRKVELEPGCSVHVSDEVEASYAQSKIGALGLQSRVENTALPAVLLTNLPTEVDAAALEIMFKPFGSRAVKLVNGMCVEMLFDDSSSALKAATILRNSNNTLFAESFKMANGKTMVRATNFKCSPGDAEKLVQSLLPSTSPKARHAASDKVTIRFSSNAPGSTLDAMLASLSDVSVGGRKLISRKVRLLKPALFVRNKSAPLVRESQLKEMLNSPAIRGLSRIQLQRAGKDLEPDLAVAYFDSPESALAAYALLKKVSIAENKTLRVEYKEVSEPAVRVGLPTGVRAKEVERLFADKGVTVVRKHRGADSLEVIFVLNSPQDVQIACNALHNARAGGARSDRISVSKHDFEGEGIEVSCSGDGEPLTAASLAAALQEQGVSASELSMSSQSPRNAFVGFLTAQEAWKACNAVEKRPAVADAEAAAAFSKCVQPLGLGYKEGGSEGFSSLHALVDCRLSALPCFTVEVHGLGDEQPASAVEQAVAADGALQVLRIERTGIVRFRRHRDVVDGVKKLKEVAAAGPHRFKALPYRTLVPEASSEYDSSGPHEAFDKMSLETLLRDNLASDPATRYKVAKNAFDRLVGDGHSLDDEWVKDLINTEKSLPSVVEEVKRIVNKEDVLNEADRTRLFELYLQREDMLVFSRGFDDLEAVHGGRKVSDAFDWTQFMIAADEDMRRLEKALEDDESARMAKLIKDSGANMKYKKYENRQKDKVNAAEIEAIYKMKDEFEKEYDTVEVPEDFDMDARNKEIMDYMGLDEDGGESEANVDPNPDPRVGAREDTNKLLEDEDEEDARIKRENEDQDVRRAKDRQRLIDEEGRMWEGLIIDTDTVQHTIPRGRYLQHRALVAIGNLEGAAGFGMGKGKEPADALAAAFRDALRNIVHVDLFEGKTFAHDLYGKHNACHAYIRATHESRLMVGGDLAEEILTLFGAKSFSVKIVGRRDPYAQVNAIFNAVTKHENLEEIARARGQRYLTLEWLHKNGL